MNMMAVPGTVAAAKKEVSANPLGGVMVVQVAPLSMERLMVPALPAPPASQAAHGAALQAAMA